MATQKQPLRAEHGVRLTKLELMNGQFVADTAYLLETLRTPEKRNFSGLAEAEAAFLEDLNLSRSSDLVGRRLGQ